MAVAVAVGHQKAAAFSTRTTGAANDISAASALSWPQPLVIFYAVGATVEVNTTWTTHLHVCKQASVVNKLHRVFRTATGTRRRLLDSPTVNHTLLQIVGNQCYNSTQSRVVARQETRV